MRHRFAAAALGIISLFVVHAAEAQVVRRTGRGEPQLDVRIDNIIGDRDYRIIARDTVIARNDTLRGPILSLGNRVIVEGTVLGTFAMIDANVYLRPTARIEGDIVNIGSGFYRSELATITGRVTDRPLAPYHVERVGQDLVIVGDTEHKLLKPAFLLPMANRVDGIMPRAGGTLTLPPMGRFSVQLYGWGAYGFEHEDWQRALQGGAELRFRHGFNQLTFGVEEATATRDDWIRSDLMNSLSFLYQGKDYRNYYESNRQYVELSRELIRESHAGAVYLRGQREDAESILRGTPWVLFKPDTFRINPFVDDGVISSGILGLRGEWTGVTAIAEYDGNIERGLDDVAGGDFDFTMFTLTTRWAMLALANHTLEIESRFQGPIGTDVLPRQRWGMLGGSGTLYTFGVGEFYGDRIAYLETEYSIPFPPRVRLPYIGSPSFDLIHTIGMAWTQGTSRDFEQNVGARIRFPFAYARFMINPADLHDSKFTVGITTPKPALPWQKSTSPLSQR
jgi:hypothetical protein